MNNDTSVSLFSLAKLSKKVDFTNTTELHFFIFLRCRKVLFKCFLQLHGGCNCLQGTGALRVPSGLLNSHIIDENYGLLGLRFGHTEGQHGEVVVLLGPVAKLVGVGLESLYHTAHT